jgi:predicted PurR-regulated permease PerM
MFLKIALSILIAVVSLLTILLDYEWVDKRFAKRKFARKALLVSLVILSLVAVWNAIADERDRARTAEQISGLEKQAQQAEAGNRESVQRLMER